MPGDMVDIRGSGPRRVVVTFPMSAGAWDHLAGQLGDRVELVDVRVADGNEDVVLLPSASRQLIGKISVAFPLAVVVVVEVEDPSFEIGLGGHVMRSLDAGADGYYVARSLDQLAGVIGHVIEPSHAAPQQQPVELTPPPHDDLSEILDRLSRPEPTSEPAEVNRRPTSAP